MATKRGHSPEFISNPFIKKKNLEWSLALSDPEHEHNESSSSAEFHEYEQNLRPKETGPEASAVEAGKARIEDYLDYFTGILAKGMLSPFPSSSSRLPIEEYHRLYGANSGNPKGAHFVIHQHDHPVAGTHYDLRLQINETSSASWAIMYGLPGDPNSQRLNRNATETRIHCLWNHLIETASTSTGSVLIWDTGTYTVLSGGESSGRTSKRGASTPSSSSSESETSAPALTEQQKLHRAFQARKIRLQLRGARLPHDYVLNLRLTKDEDAAGRAKSTRTPARRRRRRVGPATRSKGAAQPDTSSSSDSEADDTVVDAPAQKTDDSKEEISAMERELRELEDDEVRRTNAYPGASNSIGSVHQRRWYASLDRAASGFVRRRRGGGVVWERADGVAEEGEDGNEDGRLAFPFYVRGVDVERSVVTGRRGADVLRDEGVVGYVGRKGWRPVV
ncbi:DNA polymerase ligase-domain-containing protein, partial [Hypoxylon sp. FL1284]